MKRKVLKGSCRAMVKTFMTLVTETDWLIPSVNN